MGSCKTGLLALTLAAGMGMANLVRADDSDDKPPPPKSNWFVRLFVKDPAPKKTATAPGNETTQPPRPSPEVLRQKARCELFRRQEVCDKLRQIALETGDKDLARKADALDQRAWDFYVQQTGGTPGKLSPDEQLLEGRLGVGSAQPSRTSSTANGTASAGTNRSAARGD